MYIPDWFFVKKLKKMDDKLSVSWSSQKERWVIYRTIPRMGRLYHTRTPILTVQNPDGSYRPLDDRALEMLREGDTWTRGSRTVLNEAMYAQVRYQQRESRSFRQEMEDLVAEATPRSGFEIPGAGARNIPKEDAPIQPERPLDLEDDAP